ncbi:hypothetical protein [Aliiruegeria lutimaris]|uniref:Uncharacterized protein n=1 Tax=Aliiruegeria lutimaris TaxID=571298 RepID=A0A1G8LPW5_9RHOB|nr:hypothetical protein [Aliiruegeria lutimaris]SDI57724.1 hypothetical protein SAMN04488026_1004110 [Aliiruegeria lutimaris]
MQTMSAGYQSISLIVQLNWDRIFYIAAIIAALTGAAALGSLLAG